MLNHQASWPGAGPINPPRLPSPPRRTIKASSRSSLKERPLNLNSNSRQTFTKNSDSQDDLLTSNLSPRSNTIPLIELGSSLVDLKVHDSSVFHSLDNLDGLSGPSPMDTRKWNMNLNITNLSLDTMLSQTEFHSLNMEEKHRAVMRLVPLLKPYICSIVDKLVGLDYTLGAANQHLDQVDDRPPQYQTLQGYNFFVFRSKGSQKLTLSLAHRHI